MEARFFLPTLRHRHQLTRNQITGKAHGDLAETVSIQTLVILTSAGRSVPKARITRPRPATVRSSSLLTQPLRIVARSVEVVGRLVSFELSITSGIRGLGE
jgi:hypothetical protein